MLHIVRWQTCYRQDDNTSNCNAFVEKRLAADRAPTSTPRPPPHTHCRDLRQRLFVDKKADTAWYRIDTLLFHVRLTLFKASSTDLRRSDSS